MSDIEFDIEGIEKLLLDLNPGKASGPDQIPIRILREAAHQTAPVLQVIFTQSYLTGMLPQDWLSANVVAIYKKGNRSEPANYRPVSPTCVTTKIMEHIIFHSIMARLESYNLLQHYQHGLKQQHSTESQLIITMEEISRALDNHNQIDMLILDFSKAFDTVPHQRLLGKIDHYGIRDHTKNWIKTWLTSRDHSDLCRWWRGIGNHPCWLRCTTRNCPRATDVPTLHQWHWGEHQPKHQAFRRWLPPVS